MPVARVCSGDHHGVRRDRRYHVGQAPQSADREDQDIATGPPAADGQGA
jgi:hypothetical protein